MEVLKSNIKAREKRKENKENDDAIKKVPETLKLQVRSQIYLVIANVTFQTSPFLFTN